jgi:hypothetical protein
MDGFRRLVRAACVAGLGVAAATSLSGCNIQRQFEATCRTQDGSGADVDVPGRVSIDVDVPAKVTAGTPFTIRVNSIIGSPDDPPGPGVHPYGVLEVTGPVWPSNGLFTFGWSNAFPDRYSFWALGEPGEQIRVAVAAGSDGYLVAPDVVRYIDCVPDDAHIADILLVAPSAPGEAGA